MMRGLVLTATLLGLMTGVWAAEGLTYHAAESPPYFVEWITNAYGQTVAQHSVDRDLSISCVWVESPYAIRCSPPRGGRGVRRGPGGLRGVEGDRPRWVVAFLP
jgi:hypothetical protein